MIFVALVALGTYGTIAVAQPAPSDEAGSGSGSGSGAGSAEGGSADQPVEMWGAIEPGQGFLVGRTPRGVLYISAYSLIRYIDQRPAHQMFFDHLGREHNELLRHDIFSHRVMVFLKGWLAVPKLQYQVIFWTVNTTDQKAIFGVLGYQFHRAFSLYGGLNALPGTRTLTGSHPYWLAHDRVMADEYFRPFFTNGIWATGEPVDGLWYSVMTGNNLSALGITANQLSRDFAYSGTAWWMPTTHEFGPNGGFDDFEWHEDLATRFGASYTMSHEIRFTDLVSNSPDNTTIRMADSLNVFERGALANDVTINRLRYRLLGLDAGIKYHGIFVGVQYFQRWLDQFHADGPLPVDDVVDKGFYVQAAFYPIKHTLELYGVTSWVFGDKSAGYGTQYEVLGGGNWFFTHDRNIRLNAQVIWVDRSPVSSTFGYYTGGQKGVTMAAGASILF